MKYPALGILALFLRSLAETLEKNNDQDTETAPAAASPSATMTGETPSGQPTTDQPKRTRRTKEQIAADKAAEEGFAGAAAASEDKAAPFEGAMTYEELQALIQPFIKVPAGQQPRGLEVKAIIRKYTPDHDGGLKQLSTLPQHHRAFAADIEALSY